jgi:two-component system cell cycle sensor histidine kinase/response regulator CckA
MMMFGSRKPPVSAVKVRPGRALRILVVDDEEQVRKFVDRVLREGGHETALAADGAQALAMKDEMGPIDLLLTDVNMPHMLGNQLAQRLREKQPALRVLYLTGFSDQLFKEKVTLLAGEAFLDKPCSVKGLLEAVALLVTGTLESVAKK